MDSPVIDGDKDFAAAAWVSTDITEEDLARLGVSGTTNDWENMTEAEQAALIQQSIDTAKFSEITVSVRDNETWLPPITLTSDQYINVKPIVSVNSGKAVVVWQQIALTETNGSMETSTELYYSIYDGTSWFDANRIETSGYGHINDYSVVMNGSDFAVILSADDSNGIYTLHVDNAGKLTQSSLTNNQNMNVHPQIVKHGNGFIYSYYTDDSAGNRDIVLGKLKTDGTVNYTYTQSVKTAAALSGITPSANYTLISGNNETAVAWEAFNDKKDGYVIYAAKLVENNDVFSFTAPVELTMPAVDVNTAMTILDGVMDTDGSITVLYNKVGYEDFLSSDPDLARGVDLLATGLFTDNFICDVSADNDDVLPGAALPVALSITNTGTQPITEASIDWGNGDTETWSGLNLLPCEVFSKLTQVTLGQKITNLPYIVKVRFGAVEKTKTPTLFIAKPDISIGKINVTTDKQGVREFSVNLYNVSGVDLKDSGYEVHLSFFKDLDLSEPAALTGDAVISDNTRLALIDEGGMSLTYKYVIQPEDLNDEGEVPADGIRVFVRAEICDSSGNPIEESDYTENLVNVNLNSLLRYGESSITVSADRFDGTDANLTLFNRSMNKILKSNGKIVVKLLDSNAGIIETQTMFLSNDLQAEDVVSQTIRFGQTGADVVAVFEPVSSVSYSINFDANGGSVSPSTMQTGANGKLSGLPTPTRNGSYSFTGWFTAASGGTHITTESVFTQNTTVYAHWTYTGGGGGSGGGSSNGGGPSTTPSTPTPPVSTVIVDGKEVSAGLVSTSGDVTTVTISQDAFNKLLETADGNVTIVIPSETGTGVAEIVAKNVDDMAAKGISLTVNFGNVQYEIPAAAVDTANILSTLGAKNPADVSISITITTDMSAAAQTTVNTAIAASGVELVIPPMAFKVTATYNGKTVEIDTFNQYISRSVEITAEQAAKITTAVVVSPDGTICHVPTRVHQKNGKWYAEANSLTNSIYALVHSAKAFMDAKGRWYEKSVNEMGSRMIMSGIGGGMFAGERDITRAEFAVIIIRALGLPATGSGAVFSDVSRSAWYCGAVGTAYEYGLVSGIGNNQFAPDRKITRQEAMIMIRRAAKLTGFKGSTGNLNAFSDAESVNSGALDAALWERRLRLDCWF